MNPTSLAVPPLDPAPPAPWRAWAGLRAMNRPQPAARLKPNGTFRHPELAFDKLMDENQLRGVSRYTFYRFADLSQPTSIRGMSESRAPMEVFVRRMRCNPQVLVREVSNLSPFPVSVYVDPRKLADELDVRVQSLVRSDRNLVGCQRQGATRAPHVVRFHVPRQRVIGIVPMGRDDPRCVEIIRQNLEAVEKGEAIFLIEPRNIRKSLRGELVFFGDLARYAFAVAANPY